MTTENTDADFTELIAAIEKDWFSFLGDGSSSSTRPQTELHPAFLDKFFERVGRHDVLGKSALFIGARSPSLSTWLTNRFTSVTVAIPALALHARNEGDTTSVKVLPLQRIADVEALPSSDFVVCLDVMRNLSPPAIRHLLPMVLSRIDAGGIAAIEFAVRTGRSEGKDYLGQSEILGIVQDLGIRLIELAASGPVGASSIQNMILFCGQFGKPAGK